MLSRGRADKRVADSPARDPNPGKLLREVE
jgi:hypothetical protein